MVDDLPEDTGINAVVIHPERELTAEERAHLGLPPVDGGA